MNWKQHLFKPKWQHKDPDIRLTAVGSDHHPELISSLAEIAGNDEDSRVRCAAIKRLHGLHNLLTLYEHETVAEARALLEDRIRQLTASTSESRPALELRLQVAKATSNRALIEQLAAHAPEAELRRVALAKVDRQGFLGDCCIADNDVQNRRIAASGITQLTTLRRVIDGLRKRDKALYTQLQERLHQELLKQADPGAVQEEALKICTGLERLAIESDKKDPAEVEAAHSAWHRVAPMVSVAMAERYQRICVRLCAPTTAEGPADAVVEIEKIPPAAPSAAVVETVSGPAPQASEALARAASAIRQYRDESAARPKATVLTKLRSRLEKAGKQSAHPDDQAQWEASGKILQQLEQTLGKLDQLRQSELLKAQELLTQLQRELDDGELHKALATRARLQQLGKGRGSDRAWKDVNNKLSGMQGRLRELRDWHHWSNNKVRKRLIAEMEVLPSAADLHPDALLDRIKSLQAEWKALEESEQIPGDKHFAAAPWMWRKFSAAGHAAFDTARPFLDKRSEIQSREAQSLATFCAELEQLATADPPDWTAVGKGLSRGRKKLRGLDSIPARQRQKLARKLKAALDKANVVIQDHYKVVEKEKMKLIRAASQLTHLPERDEAIAQAKALQAQWKDAGSLWRSGEQKLWTQFREYLDPLFEQLKEQQATIRAADKEQLAAQKALCDELKGMLDSGEDLPGQHGKVRGLEDSWRDIRQPDRGLLNTFQVMVTDYRQRIENIQLQQINADRDRWWTKSGLLHQFAALAAKGSVTDQDSKRLQKSWPPESTDEPIEQTMDQHFQMMLAGKPVLAENDGEEPIDARARVLCIRLEFIAGLPSPDEERQQRMQYQVDRLAESMSGEVTRLPAIDEANDAEKTWLGMYTLNEADYFAFGNRIKKALAAIIVIK